MRIRSLNGWLHVWWSRLSHVHLHSLIFGQSSGLKWSGSTWSLLMDGWLERVKWYEILYDTYKTSTPQQWRSQREEVIFGDKGVRLQLPIPIDSQGLGVEKFHTCGFNVLWCFRILGIHMQMPLISFHFSKPLDLGNWAFASRLHIKNCRGTLVQKNVWHDGHAF